MFILNDFWKQKMEFLTMDKIFVLENFKIVLDKKYFFRADGRGIKIDIDISQLFDKGTDQISWNKRYTALIRKKFSCGVGKGSNNTITAEQLMIVKNQPWCTSKIWDAH